MIKIGTDCSGIEAPIQALKQIHANYTHVFSSEIDKYARMSIAANYKPSILYEDMMKDRNLGAINMYVCGFPCQPFSTAGQRKGSEDARGNIFFQCVKVIKQTEPTIFILENVTGIMSVQKGEYFKSIKNKLAALDNYLIKYIVLNTKDYGIPQNRKRIYIIGLRKDKILKEFEVPKHIKCPDIKTYVDFSNTKKEEHSPGNKKREIQFKDAVFATPYSLRACNEKNRVNPNLCSTITTQDLWCPLLQRKATIQECLSLQGFPKDFKQVVSDRQMRKQIGNSMSVNVLIQIFTECFKCVRLD